MPKKKRESREEKEKRSIAGFVLALISFIFCWVPIAGIVLGIMGIIFSSKSMKSKKRGLSIAGLIISIFSLVLAIVILIAFITAFIIAWVITKPA